MHLTGGCQQGRQVDLICRPAGVGWRKSADHPVMGWNPGLADPGPARSLERIDRGGLLRLAELAAVLRR